MANNPAVFDWGSGPPTIPGIYYPQGSYIRNNAPTAGQAEGWVCVDGGSPGTWVVSNITGAFRKYTVTRTNAAFKAASTTAAVTLGTIPAGAKVRAVTIKHSTAFAGTSITAVTVSLGDGTSTYDQYASAFDVLQAVGATVFKDTTGFGSTTSASHNLVAYFTATGANFGSGAATVLLSGSVDIWVECVQLP